MNNFFVPLHFYLKTWFFVVKAEKKCQIFKFRDFIEDIKSYLFINLYSAKTFYWCWQWLVRFIFLILTKNLVFTHHIDLDFFISIGFFLKLISCSVMFTMPNKAAFVKRQRNRVAYRSHVTKLDVSIKLYWKISIQKTLIKLRNLTVKSTTWTIKLNL